MTLNGFSHADLDHAVQHSGVALDELRGGRLLLTGGTGFFGQWLLATLLHWNRAHGGRVAISVVTRSPVAFAQACPDLSTDASVTLIAGDVRSLAIENQVFTHVIHAAADTSLDADRHPLDLVDTIVGGTRRLLDICVASGARDFLYVSSGAVYGAQGALEHVPETYLGGCNPLDRRSAYAEAKRMAEMLCTVYAAEYGLRPRVARCFAFVGPGMPLDAHFAIGNFIADALAGRTIEIKGDGTPLRSYLYVGDLVAWLIRALVLGTPGNAYNVGSDAGLSMRAIAECVATSLSNPNGFKVHGIPQQAAFRSRYVPAIDLARRDLGVDVWTSLPNAIRSTAVWASAQAKLRRLA